jgi:hypothetical protein
MLSPQPPAAFIAAVAAAEVENFRQTEITELHGVPAWYPKSVSGGSDAAVHPGQLPHPLHVSQKKCFVMLRVQCTSGTP